MITTALSVRLAWWVRPYMALLHVACRAGYRPDLESVGAFISRCGVKASVRAVKP